MGHPEVHEVCAFETDTSLRKDIFTLGLVGVIGPPCGGDQVQTTGGQPGIWWAGVGVGHGTREGNTGGLEGSVGRSAEVDIIYRNLSKSRPTTHHKPETSCQLPVYFVVLRCRIDFEAPGMHGV